MKLHDKSDEIQLVKQAQLGNMEAFSQLVRLHRSRMLGLARRIVSNGSKAEDIVQDALLLALKRIDRLSEPEKFVPWLRTIVRNRAVTSIRGLKNSSEIPASDDLEEVFASNPAMPWNGDDPQTAAVAKLALEEATNLLARLGRRERDVIVSYSLEGLSVQEVALKLGMKTGAVSTALSRSRAKLLAARYDDEIDRLIRAKTKAGRSSAIRLDTEAAFRMSGSYNSMASTMMTTAAAMGGRNVSLTDMMGLTGHAFRIQVSDDLGISSPYSFDWLHSAKSGWNHLGFSIKSFGREGVRLQRPDELIEAMETIFEALERGIPVMAWHLSNAEFGLITGFDDKARTWLVTDTSASAKKLSYNKLGRLHPDMEWFAAVPWSDIRQYEPPVLADIFTEAVRCSGGSRAVSSYACGSAAYSVWIDSMQRGQAANALAVAYNAAVTAEARAFAARFLRELPAKGALQQANPALTAAVGHARQLYERIADAWMQVSKLFPLPYGADPKAPGPSGRAAELLEDAHTLELEASAALEEAAYWLGRQRIPSRF